MNRLHLALLAALLGLTAACTSTAPASVDLLTVEGSPDALIAALDTSNQAFVEGADAQTLEERPGQALAQHPPVAVICCADSRVAPELVFGQRPGRLFVVREAGNFPDTHGIASLEYAVAKLNVPVLVVLGHSTCGAIAAASSGDDPGTPSLRALVSALQPAVHAHDHVPKGPELVELAVEENVRLGVQRLLDQSPVIAGAVERGELRLVGAVHHLDSGRVHWLDHGGQGGW